MWVWSLGQEDPLKEGMATHSSILAWESHRQRSLVGYIAHRIAKGRTWLKRLSLHIGSLADPPCSQGTKLQDALQYFSATLSMPRERLNLRYKCSFLMICKQNNYPVSHFKTYPLIVLPSVIERPGPPKKKLQRLNDISEIGIIEERKPTSKWALR